MKTLTEELWMNVPKRRAIVSIHNDVEDLVAVVRQVGTCLHLNAEQLTLEIDAASLLGPLIENLETGPCHPRYFAVVDDVMILGVDVQKQ